MLIEHFGRDTKVRAVEVYYVRHLEHLVAPAELESVLLEHPDIVDAGVVGVVSEELATELPR